MAIRSVVVLAFGAMAIALMGGARRERCEAEMAAAVRLTDVLRDLVVYEERFWADSITYTPNITTPRRFLDPFRPGPDVHILVEHASKAGWRGTATDAVTSVRCVLFIGAGPQEVAGVPEGKAACET